MTTTRRMTVGLLVGLAICVFCGVKPSAAFEQNGFSLVSYEYRGYYNAGPVLDRLVYNHADALAVNVFIYQNGLDAVNIYQHQAKTVCDEALRDLIRGCHDRGMAVLLKVNVDDAGNPLNWRGFPAAVRTGAGRYSLPRRWHAARGANAGLHGIPGPPKPCCRTG